MWNVRERDSERWLFLLKLWNNTKAAVGVIKTSAKNLLQYLWLQYGSCQLHIGISSHFHATYNPWCLFYWLPPGKREEKESNWWGFAAFCQGSNMVVQDTREKLAHCQTSICLPCCQNCGRDEKQASSSKAIINGCVGWPDLRDSSKATGPFHAAGWEVTALSVKQPPITI